MNIGKINQFPAHPLLISFVCTVLTGIAYGFGMYLFPMVMPEMMKDLELSYPLIAVVSGTAQISPYLAIPLAGFLTYRFGGLKVVVGIQLLGALLLVGYFSVDSMAGLTVVTFLIRSWPTMTWIPLVSVASDHIPFNRRGTMLTICSSAACFFLFVDGIVSSWFLKFSHWRVMWLAVAAMTLLCCILSWVAIKRARLWQFRSQRDPEKYTSQRGGISEWMMSRAGMVINGLFLTGGFSFVGFQMYLAAFLRDELALGLDITGIMWSVMGISGIIGGIVLVIATDRLGARACMFTVFFLGTLSSLVVCIFNSNAIYLAMAVAFGLAQAAFYGIGPAYISKVLPRHTASNAFTIGSMIMVTGSVISNISGGWTQGLTGSFL